MLVGTTLPENLGASARAMANFGLCDLRLVRPACDPAHPGAVALATQGRKVLAGARRFGSLAEALHDRRRVWATTALERKFLKPTVSARAAATQFGDDDAIVFGPEQSGLDYADLTLSHALLTIPTRGEARALNLGVAVALVAYEWATAQHAPPPHEPAPMGAQVQALERLERHLLARDWASEPGLRDRTLRSLRTIVLRSELSASELELLSGALKASARSR